MYIDALLNHTSFGEIEIDDSILAELNQTVQTKGTKPLLEELTRVDPESAALLHEMDVKRIVRALAVYRSTGKTLTFYKDASHSVKGDIDYLSFYLCFRDREKLYRRIDARVDEMVRNGLIEEARALYESGALQERTASQAIGYKELIPYFDNENTLDECISLLKQKSRNYAKRQITWFKRYTFAQPIYADGLEDLSDIIKERSVVFLRRYES